MTLTLNFLAEDYICESVPLQEVMQTVGPSFFQTWGGGGEAKKIAGAMIPHESLVHTCNAVLLGFIQRVNTLSIVDL